MICCTSLQILQFTTPNYITNYLRCYINYYTDIKAREIKDFISRTIRRLQLTSTKLQIIKAAPIESKGYHKQNSQLIT